MSESCGRVSVGLDGSAVSMEDLVPVVRLRDITDEVNERILQRIPRGSQVAKSSMCVVGGQGSGKSVLLRYVYWLACRKYGKERINIVYTDDVRVAFDMISDLPVQLIIVDDAMTNASSREVYKQTDIVKVYNRGRHEYEKILRGKPGLMIYIWAWQRFGELDPAFRQSDVVVFKTGIAEKSERRIIEDFLGKFYTRYLWSIWDKMNRGNNQVKGTSVARINSLDISQGVGKYLTKMVDVEFPEMILGEDYFGTEEENREILEEYRTKPGWEKRIACYELSLEGTRTQREIADMLGISRQGYVSESIRKVKALLQAK